MKKIFAILLALCLLVLSGCDSEILEKLQMPDSSAPALSVTVNVQAEFELTLNYAYQVLEVKMLNSDSEALLADMELVGDSFAGSMIAILEKAKEQSILTDETVISISTQELLEGTWTVATKDMLMRPIEKFYEQAGMTLNCDFTPAGEIPPELHPDISERNDDHSFVSYFTPDNIHYMNASFYDNGEYHVNYVRHFIWVSWLSDVEYTVSWYEDGVIYAYRVGPGGQFYCEARPVIIDTYSTVPIPETESTIQQDTPDIPSVTITPAPDGGSDETITGDEVTYYDSGNIKSQKSTLDNGDYTLECYYEDGTMSSYTSQMDGTYTEEHYDENGNSVSSYFKNSNGDEQTITYYSNGNEKSVDIIFADGDYYADTYYENGNPATSKKQMGDHYIEESFREDGKRTSSFERYSDGGEQTVIYYSNGNQKSSEVTWPDGEYLIERYCEDGTLCYRSQYMDGHLSEDKYDENGVCIYSYFKNESGYEQTITYYSNGIKKSLEMIMENGDYEYITYYESGHISCHIQKESDYVWEDYYDEDGNRTSKPSE